MVKREHNPSKWKTAGDIKETAELRGAKVERSGRWHTIETPQEKMKITSNDNQELDPQTLSNARRWFKLLGLMLLVFALYWLMGGW